MSDDRLSLKVTLRSKRLFVPYMDPSYKLKKNDQMLSE